MNYIKKEIIKTPLKQFATGKLCGSGCGNETLYTLRFNHTWDEECPKCGSMSVNQKGKWVFNKRDVKKEEEAD